MAKKYDVDVRNALWVLAVGSQIGLSIALPVVLGLAVGYWIDTRFGSLPWITLLLTLIGAIAGPILAYRWAISTVRRRFEESNRKES